MAARRRSQPGGLGKHTGRSMTRTMQRRNLTTRRILLAETAVVGGDSVLCRGSLVPRRQHNGRPPGPTGVGSTARVDSTAMKVGKVWLVAEALPHSEGAAYKDDPKAQRADQTGGWGRSTRGWTETTQLGPEPRTPGVERWLAAPLEERHPKGRPSSTLSEGTGPSPTGAKGRGKPCVLGGDAGSRLDRCGVREDTT